MAKKPSATVGYAMPTSKVKTVVQPSLVAYAKERGINLIEVDIDRPIIEQGPFDVLVHKVYGDEWNAQLRDFKVKYPDVVVFDPPEAIERIHNRESMLEAVNHLQVAPYTSDEGAFSVGTPTQIVINSGDNTQESLSTIQEKLTFPIIAKPLLANSNDKAHEISVIFTPHGLNKVQPPVILQQFVNHGGILFKVYVAGDHVKCVKRNSLPDFHSNLENPERLGSTTGDDIMSFSQISSSVVEDEDKFLKDAKMPSLDMVYTIAKGLKEGSKLNLFNFDLIRDGNDGNKYLIIDINYFPGYAKVPGFEKLLTDFFWDVINQKNKDGVAHVHRKGGILNVMYNYITSQFSRLINRT